MDLELCFGLALIVVGILVLGFGLGIWYAVHSLEKERKIWVPNSRNRSRNRTDW